MSADGAYSNAGALERWLAARADTAPDSLRRRLVDAIRAAPARGDGALAEQLLVRLLDEGCSSRLAAPDLLAADALVTYAFEAASEADDESVASIDRRAAEAMRRIATIGARGSA